MGVALDDLATMPTGWVHYVVRRHGRVVEVVEDRNLVVDLARTIMAAAVGGAAANGVITTFAVGSNLTPPVAGNASLLTPFSKPVDAVSYPAPGSVQFAFSLLPGDANGLAIGELGLLTASGLLFSRKVRGTALPKDSTVSLSGTWTLSW